MKNRSVLTLFGIVAVHLTACTGVVSTQSPAVLRPAYAGWRAIASADLVVTGQIDLRDPNSVDERGYSYARVSVQSVLKGSSEGQFDVRYAMALAEGAALSARADSSGAITNVIVFVVRAEGRAYLAASVSDAVVAHRDDLEESIRAEVAQQQILGGRRLRPPSPAGVADRTLLDRLTDPPASAEQAFATLIQLDCHSVPTIVNWLPDRRRLSLEMVSFANPNPNGLEGVVHYSPDVVTDALAIALNVITGEDFGFIHNGGSEGTRDRVVAGWRTYSAYLGAGSVECGAQE